MSKFHKGDIVRIKESHEMPETFTYDIDSLYDCLQGSIGQVTTVNEKLEYGLEPVELHIKGNLDDGWFTFFLWPENLLDFYSEHNIEDVDDLFELI